MKKVLLVAFTSLIFLVMSCKSGSDDPKEVLSQFLEALSKNDVLKARDLATADSKFTLDMMDLALKTNTREIELFDIAGKEFGEATIEGKRAIVTVKEKSSGKTMNYLLKNEDGSWKVSFDNNTLMSIGIDKLKELRGDNSDKMDSVLDEINHLNIDSLKKACNNGLKYCFLPARKSLKPNLTNN